MGSIKYTVKDDVVTEIHKVVVHRFSVGDVEDPDLYAADPLWQWQNTDAGKFIMENAVQTPSWHRAYDYSIYGHQYAVVAELEKKKLSEYYLKFDKPAG